ncbi:MAG: hypothetical protein C0402_11140 [Thermodesulfovibrio sp.]|nr:hypothetical protein [Thermodesulfovibrio sp.]
MKMNPGIGVSVIMLILLLCNTAAGETLSCKAEERFGNDGGIEHTLTLIINNGQVSALDYNNSVWSGQEGNAFSCELHLADGKPDSKWVRVGKKVRVIDKEPGEESFAEIEMLFSGRYKVHLGRVSHYHCGAGTEFPAYVIIKKSEKKCSVKNQ